MFSLAFSYFSQNQIIFSDKINLKTGYFLGQIFGNAAFEELLFRGLLFTQFYLLFKYKFSDKKAIVLAIISSQLFFAIIHIPNRLMINQVDNLLADLIKIFIVGIIFTLIYLKTKNLIYLTGVHSLVNVPLMINETKFPTPLIILFLAMAISLFWNKLNNKMKEEEEHLAVIN